MAKILTIILLFLTISSYGDSIETLIRNKKISELTTFINKSLDDGKEIKLKDFEKAINYVVSEDYSKNKKYKLSVNILIELLKKRNIKLDKKAYLHEKLSEIYKWEGKRELQQINSLKAILIFEEIAEKNMLRQLRLKYSLGKSYELSNKKDLAEKYYLNVLRHTWVFTNNKAVRSSMYENYIRAGKGLIKVRKGKLEDLQSTYFIHAANRVLLPILNDEIKAAGGEARK